MPTPIPATTSTPLLTTPADVIAIGVRSTPDGPRLLGEIPDAAAIESALAAIGGTGAVDEVRRLPVPLGAAGSIATVGLGGREPDAVALRDAAGALTRQLRGIESVVLGLPWQGAGEAAAILEGAAIGAYAFTDYRSAVEASAAPAATVLLPQAPAEAVRHAEAVAAAVGLVRDLVNTPANDLYPETLAAWAAATVESLAAEGAPITATVLDEAALEAGGYGGILAVGRGSARPPRLVVVDYRPEGAARHLSLVGKGITFDTGGLSLKPPAGMLGMKYDMTGAATVLGVVAAVARLRLPVRVTARLCIAENMPSGTATRPGDVIRMKNGLTVEVTNTDAEGRLVLGDGLVAASEERPDAIVDVATLTGAARNAFGFRTTALMGDEELGAEVVAAGRDAGESFLHVPIGPEWRPELKSDTADLMNAKVGSAIGGMLIAGAFLAEFVGRADVASDAPRIPWAHLDIAGTANNEGTAWGATGKGTTGATVRSLIRLAERFAG